MKKFLLAFGLLAATLIIALFTGCDCSNSSVNPNNSGDYQQTTTGSTAVGTAVH